jgi:NADPH2:quinone reductase
MREATRLAEAGKLAPRIDLRRFTFETICHAYEAMKTGTVAGKIIVDTEFVASPK